MDWRSLNFILVWLLLAIRLRGETNAPARLTPAAPFPSLVASANVNHIPLDGFDPPSPSDDLIPGDGTTALLTQGTKGGRSYQWIIDIEVVAPTAAERTANPPRPLELYTSFGHKMEFHSAPAFVVMRTLGPFVEPGGRKKPPALEDKSTRFSLDKGFLGLGLDQGAAVDYRLHHEAKRVKLHGFFDVSNKPFDAVRIAKGKKLLDAYNVTPGEERALAGTEPALSSYFAVVQQTPGLAKILYKTVDLPSMWSMVKEMGIEAELEYRGEHIEPIDRTACALPGEASAWMVPLRLSVNKHPSLDISLFVTAPRPPLLACGGIVGFVAENPRVRENYLTLRVVSARHRSASVKNSN